MKILNDSNSLRYFQKLTNFHQGHILHSLLLIVTLGLLLSSCGKPPKNSKFIPKDASAVICLNLKNMTTKLVTLKDLLDEDTKRIQNSGVDFTKKAYIFAKWDPKDNKKNYAGLTFMLNDESKFDAFLRKAPTKAPLEIKSAEGVKYAIVDNKIIIGWANRAVIMLGANIDVPEKEWVKRLLRLRDQPESESLAANNKYFAELETQKYDAATWLNWGNTISQIRKNSFIRRQLNALEIIAGINFKDNYITGKTFFEKGKVTSDISWHMTKALSQYEGLFKNKIDNKLLEHIPAKEPMLMLGLGLNPKTSQAVVDSSVYSKFIGAQLRRYTGLNTQQLFDMCTGDVMAALIDIEKREVPEQIIDKEGNVESKTVTKTFYKFLLGAEINNMESLDKLLGKWTSKGRLQKEGDVYTFNLDDDQQVNYLFIKDKMIFGTWTEGIKDYVMTNKGTRLDEQYVSLGKNSAFSLFADIKKENINKFPNENLDLVPFGFGTTLKKMQSPVESFSIQTTPAKDNLSNTRVIIHFNDKEKNALRALMEMVQGMDKSVMTLPKFFSGQ